MSINYFRLVMENQEIKTALQEKRHPIFVALERGLNVNPEANIQPAAIESQI